MNTMSKDNFSWIPFYTEFADKLCAYHNNRKLLIEKISEIYDALAMRLPTLEADRKVFDIDPFTVFGLFNKGITNQNRIAILTQIKELFDISATVPTNFDGIPVLNNMSATFYFFNGERGENDIDNLWSLFLYAISYADRQENETEFANAFDIVFAQKSVSWKITMGLYWIRPYAFIILDARNRKLLENNQGRFKPDIDIVKILKRMISAENYLLLIEKTKEIMSEYSSFPELSLDAWKMSTENKDDFFGENDVWFPSLAEYNPAITVEQWVELLNNPDVFTIGSLETVKRMKDYGGKATCKELSVKYGNTAPFYNMSSSQLAKRVHKATDCPLMKRENGDSRWWTILYVGKDADEETDGAFIWKLRDELSEALEMVDLSHIKLYADVVDNKTFECAAWLLSWNPSKWDWEDFDEALSLIKSGMAYYTGWTCANTKVQLGDRLFMIKCGEQPRGIFATGFVVSETYEDENYDESKTTKTRYVDVVLTDIIDYRTEEILSQDNLKSEFPEQCWSPQNSGIYIKPNVAKGLLNKWRGEKFSEDDIVQHPITYISEIVEALKELGGIGHLKEICQIIEERELLSSVKTNPNWKRNVSAELQKNCKTSKSYIEGNPNLFYHVNEKRDGIWGLVETEAKSKNKYTKSDFLSEVYMDSSVLERINFMLETKKNIILQGAPGVGKTFAAKRIAYQFMGEKNEERICFVQFHQSYCYEDFISGYKPNDTGFELKTGPFYNFCSKAKSNPDQPHFFIIDEINRGNISKIFDELLMLIEADKRNEEIMLSDGTKFSVPDNLYIIGMMNTADRSLAMIDYALRLRFSFVKFAPAFENKQFCSKLNEINNASLNKLIGVIVKLNEDIKNDSSLGEGFRIGHSYFCFDTEKVSNVNLYLKNVVEYDIIPLLEEYWFDNSNNVDEWSRKLIEAVKSDGDL